MRAIVSMDVVAAVVMPAIVVVSVVALVSLVGSARKFGPTFFPVRILGTPIVNAVSGAFLMLLACIGKRGRHIVFIVAAAVVALAQIADTHRFYSMVAKPQHHVNGKAGNKAAKGLNRENLSNEPRWGLRGNHDGQHFIARRKKYGKERAQGNNACGLQRRGSGGKAALRHHTQKRAYNGACDASATNSGDAFRARVVLERFHGEIGHEKERHELQGVDECMLESMREYFSKSFNSGTF